MLIFTDKHGDERAAEVVKVHTADLLHLRVRLETGEEMQIASARRGERGQRYTFFEGEPGPAFVAAPPPPTETPMMGPPSQIGFARKRRP